MIPCRCSQLQSPSGVVALALFAFALCPDTLRAQHSVSPEGGDGPALEEVVVTGTRIRNRDFSSPSPLTTIDRSAFEFSGQPTVEDFLNQMPQMQPGYGRTSNNPGDGTASLNLRALGSGRTLVLLNGRRLAPSGVGSAVDVNNLPRVLVDRVEIITGGASTVYGSDAIAGVVNFITPHDFSGASVESSYSITEEGDAEVFDASAVFGRDFADGGGNVSLFASYYDREPLLAAEREISEVSWQDTWQGVLVLGGSPVTPAGTINSPPVDLGNGPGQVTFEPDGTPRPRVPSIDRYNFAPVSYLQTPLKRYSAGLFSRLELNARFEAYAELALTRNEVRQNAAEAPFRGLVRVNVDNPVLTPQTRAMLAGQLADETGIARFVFSRRMLELGTRIQDHERDYVRLVAGLRGEITEGWEFDAWFTWTDADEREDLLNDGSVSRMLQGLLIDPATGECFDPSGGCVPLDVFGPGRLSQAGADFVRVSALQNRTRRTQKLASAFLTGTPFELPTGPVQVAFGAEWREDDGDFEPDEALFTGDTMGYRGSASVNGTERVYEFYTEALVPLLPASSSQRLGLELGARWSDYDNAGSVWTWKAGLDWQPLDALRFRTMFQHSVRAPNLSELFTEQFIEFGTFVGNVSVDPCSASQDPVASGNREKCIIQGLSPDQIGVFEAQQFYPVDYTLGGNPDLQPESADTFTAGFVMSPPVLPGLTFAVDYFEMEIEDTIGDIQAADICFNPVNTSNVFCENLQRDATGNVSSILQLTSNRGILATDGIDVQMNVQADLPASWAMIGGGAQFTARVYWTHLMSFEVQDNIATDVLECAGRFGWPCDPLISVPEFGASWPENRVTTLLDYASGPLHLHLTWRWIDSMDNAAPLRSAIFGFPDPDLAIPGVSAHSYVDIGIGYRLFESIDLRFGINNLFDKEPPLLADAVNSNNTDSRLYDVFGRTYFLSVAWTRER